MGLRSQDGTLKVTLSDENVAKILKMGPGSWRPMTLASGRVINIYEIQNDCNLQNNWSGIKIHFWRGDYLTSE